MNKVRDAWLDTQAYQDKLSLNKRLGLVLPKIRGIKMGEKSVSIDDRFFAMDCILHSAQLFEIGRDSMLSEHIVSRLEEISAQVN